MGMGVGMSKRVLLPLIGSCDEVLIDWRNYVRTCITEMHPDVCFEPVEASHAVQEAASGDQYLGEVLLDFN